MLTIEQAKAKLLLLLREKSVFHGDFVLSSGARSPYYVDCKLTTLDPEGAWLVGHVMHSLIESEAEKRGLKIDAVGGLTMGADPIALAVGMYSFSRGEWAADPTIYRAKNSEAARADKARRGKFQARGPGCRP